MRHQKALGEEGIGQVEVVGLPVAGELVVGYVGLASISRWTLISGAPKEETGTGNEKKRCDLHRLGQNGHTLYLLL